MTKNELLTTTFNSYIEACEALEKFLRELDNSCNDHRGNYQHLRVIGNRVYDE